MVLVLLLHHFCLNLFCFLSFFFFFLVLLSLLDVLSDG